MTSTTPAPPCSTCGGPHLRDLMFQHRTDCWHYAAELSPREADYRQPWQRALRAPTESEAALIAELGFEAPGASERHMVAVEVHPLYRRRVLLVGTSKGAIREATSSILTPTEGDNDE